MFKFKIKLKTICFLGLILFNFHFSVAQKNYLQLSNTLNFFSYSRRFSYINDSAVGAVKVSNMQFFNRSIAYERTILKSKHAQFSTNIRYQQNGIVAKLDSLFGNGIIIRKYQQYTLALGFKFLVKHDAIPLRLSYGVGFNAEKPILKQRTTKWMQRTFVPGTNQNIVDMYDEQFSIFYARKFFIGTPIIFNFSGFVNKPIYYDPLKKIKLSAFAAIHQTLMGHHSFQWTYKGESLAAIRTNKTQLEFGINFGF